MLFVSLHVYCELCNICIFAVIQAQLLSTLELLWELIPTGMGVIPISRYVVSLFFTLSPLT